MLWKPLQHVAFTWGWLNNDIWIYVDKWTMAPLRVVLFFLWFATMYWLVRKYEKQIAESSRGILELLGKNSLFVYTTHAFIVFVLKMYLIPVKTNVLQNFLITGLGLVLLIAIVYVYKTKVQGWIKTINWPPLGNRQTSP